MMVVLEKFFMIQTLERNKNIELKSFDSSLIVFLSLVISICIISIYIFL